MNLKKNMIIVGLCAVMVLAGSGFTAMAGGGPEPPAEAVILDDVVWGVAVIRCTGGVATIRVKKVDSQNCVVATEAVVDTAWEGGCLTEDLLIGESFGISFFNIQGTPFISKVKNYKSEGVILSFDAQIKFFE